MVDTVDLEETKITSEAEAFAFLQRSLAKDLESTSVNVSFDGWPQITLGLDGKGYDSTITTHVAAALIELQQAVNRTYARALKGVSNSNVLTNEQKRSVEFKAKVEKGSSVITVDLGPFANNLANALVGKMTGTELALTIVGVAVAAGGTVVMRNYIRTRSEEKKLEVETKGRIAMSQEETQRMAIFAQAQAQVPAVRIATEEFDQTRHAMMKAVGDAANVNLQGVKLTNAEAHTLAANPRDRAVDVQLNGNYLIDKLDWTKEGEVRISVRSVDRPLAFTAKLVTAALKQDFKDKLKASEWERKKVYMAVNATQLREEITTATIISVEWPPEKPTGAA